MKDDDKRLHCSAEKRNSIREAIAATRNRRAGQIVKCLELKLNLSKMNERQTEELRMLFVEGKWFYNHVLDMRRSQNIRFSEMNTSLVREVRHFGKDGEEIISELKFLKSQQKQQIVSRMNENENAMFSLIKRGYQTHGELKFKSELNCIPLLQYGISYVFKGESTVRIQGIHGRIHLHGTHQLRGIDEFANANLVHRPDGYYLKVTGYIDKENFKEVPCNGRELGLDFGIKTNITTSEGERIDISVGESGHLKVLQRKLARQAKGSNNRKRTIQKIRVAYQKQNNKKKDKCNKFIHRMKAYRVVAMQDERVASWHTRKGMSGAVQHSCMGMVKARLKAMPNVIVLEDSIPTTKWCPSCGREHEMPLDERRYVCECGRSLDRDLHAARNMLEIAHLVLGKTLVPTEHREVKRVEFLSKTGMTKHEADQPSGCR